MIAGAATTMPRHEATLRGRAASTAIASAAEAAAAATATATAAAGAAADTSGGASVITEAMIHNTAVQIGMTASTAIGRQLAHAACPRRSGKDADKQAESPGINQYLDYDVNGELTPQPPTPIKFIGEPPPGMELFRMNDTGDEVNSAGSLDIDDKDYQNTPSMRQQAESILGRLQEDDFQKDMVANDMQDHMNNLSQQVCSLSKEVNPIDETRINPIDENAEKANQIDESRVNPIDENEVTAVKPGASQQKPSQQKQHT